MAHQLTVLDNGLAEMAYAGATPWHGLGQKVDAEASIEDWRIAAKLDWQIQRSPVCFTASEGMRFVNGQPVIENTLKPYPKQHVLYRSDNAMPLSVVSDSYKVVQPEAMLEFYRDLVATEGFKIETVGSLNGGRRIWALATTNMTAEIVKGDHINNYLLLVTSCDGSLATTGMFTSVRVVCNNTLSYALGKSASAVRVRHSSLFNPDNMKGKLGLLGRSSFQQFSEQLQQLANVTVSYEKAENLVASWMQTASISGDVRKTKGYQSILGLFAGKGKGSELDGVAWTAWGLLNAVTEYADFHARANSAENRLNSAWFGAGANLKTQAMETLVEA